MLERIDKRPLHPCPPVRATGPSGASLWYISRNADVRKVLSCPFASSDPSKPGFPEPEDLDSRTPFLIELDAPRHADLRRLVLPEFGTRSVNAIAPRIEASAQRLVAAMRASGPTASLRDDYARPLASLAICHLLEVPELEGPWLTEIATTLADDSLDADAQGAAFVAVSAYMEGVVDDRITRPGSDLFSRLAKGALAEGSISRAELVALAILLLMAGHDTNAKMIELGVGTLLDHPRAVAWIVSTPEAAFAAVDELVRLHSIADDDGFRVATGDIEVGGVRIKAGDGIVPLVRHANHDPAVFEDPHLFDLDRNTNAHLGFGFGPHLCLGRPLARLTQATAYRILFSEVPGLCQASKRGEPLTVSGW
ncbi:cytochrome P450 [Sphingomonas sp. BIUV-7]|uniref:Cytochrome P450 n=1 Tax=Sphingomonas natans TaxID=3063330 RepID=A0ABT8YBM5_9SPHN|nr:cytochrome P450 [Sphingomonas sp. BIUV-7]MDO6415392.1 cytochrome P450 [Sphingomonas sp. BIUV-7]